MKSAPDGLRKQEPALGTRTVSATVAAGGSGHVRAAAASRASIVAVLAHTAFSAGRVAVTARRGVCAARASAARPVILPATGVFGVLASATSEDREHNQRARCTG